MDLLYQIILYPIIFIFPAYAANGAPVIFGRGKRTPLDLNKKFRGKRIFGEHKTVRGLVGGLVCGVLAGFLESLAPGFGFMFIVGIAESFGTHFGDLLGSFAKRQAGITSGHPVPLLDQYPFLVFALIFAIPFSLQYGYFPSIYGIVFLVVLTGVMHVLTNRGAHKLKIKAVPW